MPSSTFTKLLAAVGIAGYTMAVLPAPVQAQCQPAKTACNPCNPCNPCAAANPKESTFPPNGLSCLRNSAIDLTLVDSSVDQYFFRHKDPELAGHIQNLRLPGELLYKVY